MQNVPKPGNDMGGMITSMPGTAIAASWLTSRGPMVSWKKPLLMLAMETPFCVVSVA